MLIKLGDKIPNVHEDSFIAPNAALAGDITLAKGVSVWFNVSMRGDASSITIGENSNIQDNAIIHLDADYPVVVGENVTIGHNAIIHGCTIEDNVVIGMGAIVLNGAKIGKGSIIGAGAVIGEGKEIPPRSLVVGIPGKVIRELDEATEKSNIQNAQWYVNNGIRYRDTAEIIED